MEINKIHITKLPILDGIEIKSASFIDKNFPLHFHQNWSLAYIKLGAENIAFDNLDFLLNKDALILIPPFSLHKNWGTKNNIWTYNALYLNEDIIKNIAQKINLDYHYLASFPYFITYHTEAIHISPVSIFQLLENLFLKSIKTPKESNITKGDSSNLDEVIDFLHLNFNSSISLDSLEKKFKVNKFKLLKRFKLKVGLTPLEYQTAYRIEKSKELFFEDIPLTHIALESGFYDQSHFTHNFKKYVGVTPGRYKSNCNILQDWI